MVSRHDNYETSYYSYSPAQKIAIFAALTLAIILIAIIGGFVYDFVETYHQWLNRAVFYLCGVIGVAVVILIAAFTTYTVAMLMLRYSSSRLDSLQQAQNVAAGQANTDLFNATAKQIKSGAVYLSEQRTVDGIIRFKALPKHTRIKQKPTTEAFLKLSQPETLPEIKNSLLRDLEPLQRILIVGGQNSGKTTLLKHIAKQRSAAGSVLVLDSHNTAGKWSNAYRIIGHGRDYPAIEKELKNLVAVMDSRYKELASGKIGERQHELITVISDEWTTVSRHIQNLDAYLLPLLTESRKVGIDFILATHSQTAESLGLKGKADLKTAFDVTLILKNIGGKRLVDLDNGEKIVNYQHCGQYNQPESFFNSSAILSKSLDKILNDDSIKYTAIIDKYHELKASDSFSWNKLSRAIYGNSNGAKVAELKRVLERHGIVTTQ